MGFGSRSLIFSASSGHALEPVSGSRLPGTSGLVFICSSSSGVEGAVLDMVRPIGVLPFRFVKASGVVCSAEAKVAGVGAGDSIGTAWIARLELLET
ncbi:hypothetical protein V6N13_030081 [Hibiscus sabdariffa]